MNKDHDLHGECENCNDWFKNKGLKVKAPFILKATDLPVKGKMSGEDYSDYVIDLNTLSTHEFMKKYC
jgi:hypothetical protein